MTFTFVPFLLLIILANDCINSLIKAKKKRCYNKIINKEKSSKILVELKVKSQITISKSIVDSMGLKIGDQFEILEETLHPSLKKRKLILLKAYNKGFREIKGT